MLGSPFSCARIDLEGESRGAVAVIAGRMAEIRFNSGQLEAGAFGIAPLRSALAVSGCRDRIQWRDVSQPIPGRVPIGSILQFFSGVCPSHQENQTDIGEGQPKIVTF
jgi:hypothetical protein